MLPPYSSFMASACGSNLRGAAADSASSFRTGRILVTLLVLVSSASALGAGSAHSSAAIRRARGALLLAEQQAYHQHWYLPAIRELVAFHLGLEGLQVVVDDADAARAQLVERGVEASEVQEFPWGRFVFFSDPDGNAWAIQQIPQR